MPESSLSTNPTVKRACDPCHRRKVKCIGDGTRQCKNCTSATLTCTYNAVPQKKGPKGSRAKVISELRDTQLQLQLAAQRQSLDFDEQAAAAFRMTPGLVSMEMITACVDYFFTDLYPTQPILHRRNVGQIIGLMETNIEAYCLVMSLCAYMMIQPNMVLPPGAFDGLDTMPQSPLQLGQTLLYEALTVRKRYNFVEVPSVWAVMTSFFFFGSHFCLDKHNSAWFHLREATTLAQIIGMHEETYYNIPDTAESSRRRRLYWLLFVTERAYALQRHRPLTLHATIDLPTLDEDPAESIELNGFIHLVTLFRPFDDTFVGLWNKNKTEITTEWLAQLQQQLSDALPAYLQSTESQAVDLRCSQQWLRTMVWQLSISHGMLSSVAANKTMSFKFPIEVSRDLVAFASQFSQQAMEVHGIGLIEKLFDVACTLTDVMACVPYERHTFEYGPLDYLNQLTSLVSTLRGGQQRYLPLLLAKINDIIPSGKPPAFALPVVLQRSGVEELYDGSQSHSSAPSSRDCTPVESPTTGATSSLGFQDLNVISPTTANLPANIMNDVSYGDLTVSAPMLVFQDSAPLAYPGTAAPGQYENGS